METIKIDNTTYQVENKYDYYPLLLDEPCCGCAAYENLGHCGIWRPGCWVLTAKCQIDSLKANTKLVDEGEILDWLLWKDCEETQFLDDMDWKDFLRDLVEDPYEEIRYLTDKELYL